MEKGKARIKEILLDEEAQKVVREIEEKDIELLRLFNERSYKDMLEETGIELDSTRRSRSHVMLKRSCSRILMLCENLRYNQKLRDKLGREYIKDQELLRILEAEDDLLSSILKLSTRLYDNFNEYEYVHRRGFDNAKLILRNLLKLLDIFLARLNDEI